MNAVAAVKTACGVRFFSSDPTNIGPHALHRIGSVTKTYVGSLILTLEKEGVLHLEDTVSKWVAGVPNGDAITIRQLLRHQSGLFDVTSDAEVWPVTTPRTWTPEELLAVASRHPPDFSPGTKWEYSNTNYVVAGLVAEAATGTPIVQLLHSRILGPLHLNETFLASDEPLGDHRLARGFDGDTEVTNQGVTWAWAAGAIAATPGDVVEWIDRLGSGAFLDQTEQARLLDTVPADPATVGADDGLGVFKVVDPALGTFIFHTGGIDGYTTLAIHFVDKHVSIASMVDNFGEHVDANAIVNGLSAILFPATASAAAGSKP